MAVVITSVTPRSPAAKAGVKACETLRAINVHEINDALGVFDQLGKVRRVVVLHEIAVLVHEGFVGVQEGL